MSYEEWERDVYPKMWAEAYEAGKKAKEDGLPRTCNLTDSNFCHDGNPLRVWRQVWEQGWDGWSIPAEFKQVEEALKDLPARSFTTDDLK